MVKSRGFQKNDPERPTNTSSRRQSLMIPKTAKIITKVTKELTLIIEMKLLLIYFKT